MHRRVDLDVLAAAANVAGQGFANVRVGRIGVCLQQRVRAHDEATRANTALVPALFPEGALEWVQTIDTRTLPDAFDGQDLLTAAQSRGQHGAGVDCAAVDNHRAGAALRTVAT